VPSGYKILLKFIDLRTEYCDDFVQVFDGNSVNNVLMGKFCGSDKPRKLISTSNYMTIKFTSDFDSNYKGFSADYTIFNESKFCMNLVFMYFFQFRYLQYSFFSF
jgi:hypothetical protein